MEIKENEEEASMEAKVASRILTTLETNNHKIELRKKLDYMFEKGSSKDEEDDITTYTDNTSMNDNEATEYAAEYSEEGSSVEFDENPFMETEEVLRSIACF
ncbi:unnamed protein product [Rhizopus stolonifer]